MLSGAKNAAAKTFYNAMLFQPAVGGVVVNTTASQRLALLLGMTMVSTRIDPVNGKLRIGQNDTMQKTVATSLSTLTLPKQSDSVAKLSLSSVAEALFIKAQDTYTKILSSGVVVSSAAQFNPVKDSNTYLRSGVSLVNQRTAVKDAINSFRIGAGLVNQARPVLQLLTRVKIGLFNLVQSRPPRNQSTETKFSIVSIVSKSNEFNLMNVVKVGAGSSTDKLKTAQANAPIKMSVSAILNLTLLRGQISSLRTGGGIVVSILRPTQLDTYTKNTSVVVVSSALQALRIKQSTAHGKFGVGAALEQVRLNELQGFSRLSIVQTLQLLGIQFVNGFTAIEGGPSVIIVDPCNDFINSRDMFLGVRDWEQEQLDLIQSLRDRGFKF
jgi:hypothetical protein